MRRYIWAAGLLLLVAMFVSWSVLRIDEPQSQTSKPQSARNAAHTVIAAKQPKMTLDPAPPVTLSIEKLGVTAQVDPVGLNAKGEMQEPAKSSNASWYKYGYMPGTLGNAVIAGHYTYLSKPSIFHGLDQLKPGDEVRVRNEHHKQLTFRVIGSAQYPTAEAPRDEIFGGSTKAQLHLITCFGAWDDAIQQYAQRLVVTAEFVSETNAP